MHAGSNDFAGGLSSGGQSSAGHLGLPRNFLRGTSYINLDMALSKTTAITEKVKIEFRAEFFNVANHANFLNPNVVNSYHGFLTGLGSGTNPNSSLFGQITSTYDSRIIQLALRLSF